MKQSLELIVLAGLFSVTELILQSHAVFTLHLTAANKLQAGSKNYDYATASFPDVSLFLRDKSAQRTMGMGKVERRLDDFVSKMAESAIADDYVIFRNEFRPVHLAYLEQKIVCPDPQCKEKPIFC